MKLFDSMKVRYYSKRCDVNNVWYKIMIAIKKNGKKNYYGVLPYSNKSTKLCS